MNVPSGDGKAGLAGAGREEVVRPAPLPCGSTVETMIPGGLLGSTRADGVATGDWKATASLAAATGDLKAVAVPAMGALTSVDPGSLGVAMTQCCGTLVAPVQL